MNTNKHESASGGTSLSRPRSTKAKLLIYFSVSVFSLSAFLFVAANIPTTSLTINSATGNLVLPSTYSGSVNFGTRLALATDQLDRALAGADVSSTKNLYSSISHTGSGTYVRSTNSWLRNTDMTCVGVYDSGGASAITAITPQDVLIAHHVGAPANGAEIRFATAGNVSVSRTISIQGELGSTDIQIAHLNSPLPDTITPAKVLDSPIETTSQLFRASFWIDQNQNAYVTQITSAGGGELNFVPSQYKQRAAFTHDPVSGDSGSPVFYLVDQPILLGAVHTTLFPSGHGGSCSWISNNFAAINAKLTALGSSYQLTPYSATLPAPQPPTLRNGQQPSEIMPLGAVLSDGNGFPAVNPGTFSSGISNTDRGLYDPTGTLVLSFDEHNEVDIPDTVTLKIGANTVLVGDALHDFVSDFGFAYNDDNLSELADKAAACANIAAPHCAKYTVGYATLKTHTGAANVVITLGSIPANSVILDWMIKTNTRFVGANTVGIPTIPLTGTDQHIGTAGYSCSVAAVGATNFEADATDNGAVPFQLNTGSTSALKCEFDFADSNPQDLTAGSVDIWFTYLTRP